MLRESLLLALHGKKIQVPPKHLGYKSKKKIFGIQSDVKLCNPPRCFLLPSRSSFVVSLLNVFLSLSHFMQLYSNCFVHTGVGARIMHVFIHIICIELSCQQQQTVV